MFTGESLYGCLVALASNTKVVYMLSTFVERKQNGYSLYW
jgi:hypothetical protein